MWYWMKSMLLSTVIALAIFIGITQVHADEKRIQIYNDTDKKENVAVYPDAGFSYFGSYPLMPHTTLSLSVPNNLMEENNLIIFQIRYWTKDCRETVQFSSSMEPIKVSTILKNSCTRFWYPGRGVLS